MKQAIFCFVWFLLVSCSPESSTKKSFVRLPQSFLTKSFVEETEFIRDSKYDDYYAFGYLDPKFIRDSKIEELDEAKLRKFKYDPKTLITEEEHPASEKYEDYHHYEALTTELKNQQSQYPNLVKLDTAGKSVENRELWFVKITNNVQQESGKPNFLYIANMHGDEATGRELMIYMIRLLTSSYGSDARITNLLNNAQIFIMPSMNPDGFEKEQRENAAGSDLNRSFPDFTSDPYDVPNKRPVEVQAVMRLMDKYHFVTSLNFHGGEVCYNLVWDTQANTGSKKFAEDALSYKLGRNYTQLNKSMYNGGFDNGLTYGYEWYEVNGGMQDWATYYRQSIQATVELSSAKYPSASSLPTYWNENKEALLDHMISGLRGIHINVMDSYGNPLFPKVTVSNRKLIYRTNLIHRPTLDGEYDVKIEAEGFKPLNTKIKSSVFSGTYENIMLCKIKG